jgi:TonB-dependent starch-binding outer membrane protein SusC
MIKKILLFLSASLIMLAVTATAYAQSGSLTGTVTDRTSGETLPGATVLVTELDRGAPANIDGVYSITNIPVGTYTVRFSFVGYRTLTETIQIQAGENRFNAQLRLDQTGLEEVVVTGIASRTSRAVSEVAVARVDAGRFTESQSYQDLSQLVSGKVAGVSVQPAGGTVGAGIRFNVRSGGGIGGSGQPVIIMDGVVIDNSQLSKRWPWWSGYRYSSRYQYGRSGKH